MFPEGSIERLEGVSEPLILKWLKKEGKKIKNAFNNSINKIQDDIDSLDENNIIKKENIEVLEVDEIVTFIKKNSKISIQKQEQKNITLPTYGLL